MVFLGANTYVIGSKRDSQYIRISGNSAGGIYCKEWVSMAKILQLLAVNPNANSKALKPLYAGRSTNSPGFLLGALVHENMCNAGKATPSSPEAPPQKKPAKKNTTKA
jgi:hypothetical protein